MCAIFIFPVNKTVVAAGGFQGVERKRRKIKGRSKLDQIGGEQGGGGWAGFSDLHSNRFYID